jgi:hypothetical protein
MENEEKKQIIITFIENEDGNTINFEKKNLSDIEALGALRLYEQAMSVKMLSKDKPKSE